MQTQTSEFWKLFRPAACSVDLRAGEQRGLFEEVVGHMGRAKVLAPDLAGAAVEALIERERKASTGIGMNVAIPHVALPGLERVAVSLAVHHGGVEWHALDGEPVHLLFTVLRPDRAGAHHDPERHLAMMRWISQLSRQGDFRRFALGARTRTELVDLLREMSGS